MNYSFELNFNEKKILVCENQIPLVIYTLKSFIENKKDKVRQKEWTECKKWIMENHPELLL